MNLGKSIKQIRLEKGISQGELAKAAGISQTSMSLIEKGKTFPNHNTIEKICNVLSVSYAFLLVASLTEDDVAEEKRELFQKLSPAIKGLLDQVI